MSNVLVTGVNGFVGKHLARELNSQGHTVYGAGKAESEIAADIKPIVADYWQCDLIDKEDVSRLPLEKFGSVINLAGLAAVGPSFDKPDLYMKVNVEVLTTIGELLLNRNSKAKVLAISSGALYDPNQPIPLSEDAKTVQKGSPYAKSKLAMEKAASTFTEKGLECIVARPFNHIGPGQDTGFLLPDMYVQLKKHLESGDPIITGNISTRRDYTDVRDIVKAYTLLATSDKKLQHSIYNVCSGKSSSGEDILSLLCESMDTSKNNIETIVDQSLIRPTDPQDIVGDNTRLHDDTGWEPSIPLTKTIKDFVESKS